MGQAWPTNVIMLHQLLRAKLKAELRRALEVELERLGARVEAIRVLLETPERGSTNPPHGKETVRGTKRVDGRRLRWQIGNTRAEKSVGGCGKKGTKAPKTQCTVASPHRAGASVHGPYVVVRPTDE